MKKIVKIKLIIKLPNKYTYPYNLYQLPKMINK